MEDSRKFDDVRTALFPVGNEPSLWIKPCNRLSVVGDTILGKLLVL